MYRKPLDTIIYNNLSENSVLKKKKYKNNPLKGKDNEDINKRLLSLAIARFPQIQRDKDLKPFSCIFRTASNLNPLSTAILRKGYLWALSKTRRRSKEDFDGDSGNKKDA